MISNNDSAICQKVVEVNNVFRGFQIEVKPEPRRQMYVAKTDVA